MRRSIVVCGVLAALIAVAATTGVAVAASPIVMIYGFKGDDGGSPNGGLVLDAAGNLYGTTNTEGDCLGCGTVFRLRPSSFGEWTPDVLYRFPEATTEEGDNPYAPVVFGPHSTPSKPTLYGTTPNGGEFYGGTVYEVTGNPFKPWTPIYIFGGNKVPDPNGGLNLFDPVVFDADGALYGQTEEGGTGEGGGGGVIFKLTPKAGLWAETVLYNFCNWNDPHIKCPKGSLPKGGLVIDADGTLYGTTFYGGKYKSGVVFRLTENPKVPPADRYTVLYDFCKKTQCSDGSTPATGVILDKSGALYGTTTGGGYKDSGVIFKLTPPLTGGTDWDYNVVYEFCRKPACTDDLVKPHGGLVIDPNGALYGVTSAPVGNGVIYKVVPGSPPTEKVLGSFAAFGSKAPGGAIGRLTIDISTGTLYGATLYGGYKSCGGYYCGTVYEVDQPDYHAP
jgi:uncharacterized repeat protein (TIGR03803 family)